MMESESLETFKRNPFAFEFLKNSRELSFCMQARLQTVDDIKKDIKQLREEELITQDMETRLLSASIGDSLSIDFIVIGLKLAAGRNNQPVHQDVFDELWKQYAGAALLYSAPDVCAA